MEIILTLILTAVVSYLLGSLNSAIIVVKILKKTDIREHGSKNAGLTNTLRCFGKTAAVLTLIGDLLKGVVAVLLSQFVIARLLGIEYENFHEIAYLGYVAGFFAIIGHILPIYYGFKGGKGILVSCSILLVIDPISFVILIPFFLLMVFVTKYVSVASMLAAVAYPIVTFFTQYFREWGTETALLDASLSLLSAIVLIYMHKTNIVRLKNGTENKFSIKKKEKSS